MSVKSAIWVHAHLRRCAAKGLYGAVLKHGADEAGAVYAVVNRLDGTSRVMAPAPGPAYDDIGERRFTEIMSAATPLDVAALIARLTRVDPDIWMIEIEDRSGAGEFHVVNPD
ncbi:DUF1491 family protein [soil metagenome]